METAGDGQRRECAGGDEVLGTRQVIQLRSTRPWLGQWTALSGIIGGIGMRSGQGTLSKKLSVTLRLDDFG